MKRNNKGFTLIELLAVIVILAVIALIATPIIMGVINNAKSGADKDSAYGIVKTLETAIAQKMIDDPNFAVPASCTIASNGSNCTYTPAGGGDSVVINIDYKGTKPTGGEIKFNTAKGSVDKDSTVIMPTGTFTMQANGEFK